MKDGDEHEVPRPKLVRTGCRLFWHRDWVWEGDTRGEWSIAESEILWGEGGLVSMKWGLERWWVMMMMWWSVCGSEISCDEWGYVSMLGGLCEDWCDVVMPLSFLYNWNSVKWMTNYLYEMRFGEMLCDVVMPLSFLYNSNFMWWTTNYLYEMKLDYTDAVISSTHSYHPIIQILWDQPSTISIWYHFQQWCLHHLSTPILSDFAPIQIPWGSYTYVPC